MSVLNEYSVLSDNPLSPELTMEIVLDALRELIDYELAVVLSMEDSKQLKVRKAVGPLYTRELDDFYISLEQRRDIADIIDKRMPYLFKETEKHVDTYHDILNLPDGHSCLVSPLYVQDKAIGLLTLDHRSCNKFTPSMVRFIESISKLISVSMLQSDSSQILFTKTRRLLEERKRLLGEESELFRDLIGNSSSWTRVIDSIRMVSDSDVPVLILGETGTGKEQVAKKIHALSGRATAPFIAVNCSALVSSLAESELFGHEKGSFSGASALRRGRFELADGGTLFLDEVGDLPVNLQPKLLRVLQDGKYERVGGEKSLYSNVRIIAATNTDLEKAVAEARFREDLLYRLNVFPILLPPLRERGEDSALLAEFFISQIRSRQGYSQLRLSASALDYILNLSWKGNVRELRNCMERAAILSGGKAVLREHIVINPAAAKNPVQQAYSVSDNVQGISLSSETEFLGLEEIQKQHIQQALRRCRGKIYGKDGAAFLLGIKPTTLQSKMKRLNIQVTDNRIQTV